MRLESAAITFLVGQDKTTIEIRDNNAAITFLEVELTPEQLSAALSRLGNTPCSVQVFNLDKIGKKQETKKFEFEIPERLTGSSMSNELWHLAVDELAKAGMSEWIPDKYFGSQDSFFSSNSGKIYARATIRKWS